MREPGQYRGGYLATQHLIAQGRSRIAFLASSLAHYSIRQREKGYRQALYEARLLMPPEYEAIAPPLLDTEQSLVEAVNELLSLPEPPDAILPITTRQRWLFNGCVRSRVYVSRKILRWWGLMILMLRLVTSTTHHHCG